VCEAHCVYVSMFLTVLYPCTGSLVYQAPIMIISSGIPRNFVWVGGFNKFSWGQRTEKTGIWGR